MFRMAQLQVAMLHSVQMRPNPTALMRPMNLKKQGSAEADLVKVFEEKETAEPGLFKIIISIFKIDLMYIKDLI